MTAAWTIARGAAPSSEGLCVACRADFGFAITPPSGHLAACVKCGTGCSWWNLSGGGRPSDVADPRLGSQICYYCYCGFLVCLSASVERQPVEGILLVAYATELRLLCSHLWSLCHTETATPIYNFAAPELHS